MLPNFDVLLAVFLLKPSPRALDSTNTMWCLVIGAAYWNYSGSIDCFWVILFQWIKID
jgi:hypothetical protein